MKERKSNERGQVGIGTLIVFISLVLVAAIASSVLLGSADLLQERGEQTSEESTDEVSNKLVEYQSYLVTNTSSGVKEIDVKVRKAAGSDQIDLADLTVEYLEGSTQATLGDGSALSATTTEGDGILSSQSERGTLTIDLTSAPIEQTADAEDDISLTIVTDSGAETNVELQVPDNPESDSTIRPQ